MFKELEKSTTRSRTPLAEVLTHLRFNEDGLIPVIAQQFDTGAVLMLAWMNAEALEETLSTGRVCYFSRSRQRLWRKGEESGQIQRLRHCYIDCDGDTLLVQVDQMGPACHTGRSGCFYLRIDEKEVIVHQPVLVDPDHLYGRATRSSVETTSSVDIAQPSPDPEEPIPS